MKSALITAAWMLLWTSLAMALSGCVTTTTTAKDGTVTTVRQPVPGVLPFAADVIRAYSPRAIPVHEK